MKKQFLYTVALAALCSTALRADVLQINSEDHYKQAMSSNKNMVVEFSADWCSVCNGINTPFEEIAGETEFQQVAFAKVNVDKLDSVSKQNGIVGVPTFLYVEGGQKKVEEIGVQNMPAFKDHLRENLRKNFKLAQNETPQEIAPAMATAEVIVDVEAPIPARAHVEPNFFMKIILGVKNFIMMIFMKIAEFFTTIFDAIKGFFG
jgi:thiol-disulfide isomerase/thioredoxin